jgi:hypothetical protein
MTRHSKAVQALRSRARHLAYKRRPKPAKEPAMPTGSPPMSNRDMLEEIRSIRKVIELTADMLEQHAHMVMTFEALERILADLPPDMGELTDIRVIVASMLKELRDG